MLSYFSPLRQTVIGREENGRQKRGLNRLILGFKSVTWPLRSLKGQLWHLPILKCNGYHSTAGLQEDICWVYFHRCGISFKSDYIVYDFISLSFNRLKKVFLTLVLRRLISLNTVNQSLELYGCQLCLCGSMVLSKKVGRQDLWLRI